MLVPLNKGMHSGGSAADYRYAAVVMGVSEDTEQVDLAVSYVTFVTQAHRSGLSWLPHLETNTKTEPQY
jgi:hypothetical protein